MTKSMHEPLAKDVGVTNITQEDSTKTGFGIKRLVLSVSTLGTGSGVIAVFRSYCRPHRYPVDIRTHSLLRT